MPYYEQLQYLKWRTISAQRSLLTALLGALYAGLILGLESVAGLLTGQVGTNPVVIVISTLAIWARFFPLRKRVQSIIDQRFYRRKYNAEKTLAAFSAALRNETERSRKGLLLCRPLRTRLSRSSNAGG